MDTLILTRADALALTDMAEAVDAVRGAFRAHATGQTKMPPKVYLTLPEHAGDFRAMPSAMDGAAGVKWVNSHPENPARHGLPAVMGVFILSDPATALPLAVMDASWLTAVRTGAAAAVASAALGKRGARSLGFVGSGVQARTMALAHRVTHPDAGELVFADVRPEAAERLARELGGRVGTIAEAAACDIVNTSTPGATPVVMREMVRPGAHINAMGADAEGKQELESALTIACHIFVDDPAQAFHSGEVNVPLHHGDLRETAIAGSLGAVLHGALVGREHDDQITLFDSTGLAVQDLAVARLVVARARARGVGIAVPLVG
ncbi:MAG: ornithine cyclodeaminase family protein [Deltaproteobacteria bacterium]|nr:ornithine cyclodeaminase family protein [Deltaproteobacteria bacterium]